MKRKQTSKKEIKEQLQKGSDIEVPITPDEVYYPTLEQIRVEEAYRSEMEELEEDDELCD